MNVKKPLLIGKAPVALRAALLCLSLLLLLSACMPLPIPPSSDAQLEPRKPDDLDSLYRLMVGTGLLPDMAPVPNSLVPSVYGINLALASDAVFMVAQDPLRADEVVLITARDEAGANQIQIHLNTRLAQKEIAAMGQDPAQYAMILDAHLSRNGVNLALIVSPDADQLAQVYVENR
ncbi:MAG: DUF4358 domain-containing protein [Eubacteriales bacterium]|nr:DUF4358 domain-containing protein [Eubacteriales bacterium]